MLLYEFFCLTTDVVHLRFTFVENFHAADIQYLKASKHNLKIHISSHL